MEYLTNFLFNATGISYLLIWLMVFISIIDKKRTIKFWTVSMILLFSFLFLGLRSNTSGTDTINYVKYFNSDTPNEGFEAFYNAFTYLLRLITGPEGFVFANVFVQMLLIVLICRIIKLQNMALVLLAYVSFLPGFDMLTNGLRQGLSTCIVTLIFVLAYQRQVIPKITAFCVVFLHKSTLTFGIFYFLAWIKNEKYLFRIINVLAIAFVLLIASWHVINFTEDLAGFATAVSMPMFDVDQSVGNKFNIYLIAEQEILLGAFKYYFLLILLGFLSTFYIYRKQIKMLPDKRQILLFAMLVFLLALPYALIWQSPYSYRFMYSAFLPGLVFAVKMVEIGNQRKHMLYLLLILLVSAVLTYGSNTYLNFTYIFA
nr:EpsG family protein [uncultured Fluviicola sp.]